MITTDTGAKKWENSDNWRQIYQAHNDSVDAEDAAIAALQDAIAIVANGNTHAAIAAGQFVFVKNHDTLAAGLYTANSAIAANATLTSSNLTEDPSGGFNALNSNLANLFKYVEAWYKILDTGTLAAGSNGNLEISFTVPDGYKTTGITSFYFGHLYYARGMSLAGGVAPGKTGSRTVSVSYSTPRDIDAAYTDFCCVVQCIKTSSVIS